MSSTDVVVHGRRASSKAGDPSYYITKVPEPATGGVFAGAALLRLSVKRRRK